MHTEGGWRRQGKDRGRNNYVEGNADKQKPNPGYMKCWETRRSGAQNHYFSGMSMLSFTDDSQ